MKLKPTYTHAYKSWQKDSEEKAKFSHSVRQDKEKDKSTKKTKALKRKIKRWKREKKKGKEKR